MLSRKDLNSAELDTVRVSRNSITVITANVEVQTNEEATVHVYDLDSFVTVHTFEDTPPVLSLGEDHGYSFEWSSGQKPHISKNGRNIQCNTGNNVAIVVPKLSTGSSSSTTIPLLQVQQQHDVEVPAVQYWETSCAIPSNYWEIARTPIQYREACGAICQSGWKTSQKILRTKECQHHGTHPEALLVNQTRNLQEKWYRGNTISLLTSRKTEVAKYARGPRAPCRRRIGGAAPRAENVGDLITADHEVLSEGCESRNNHRYAVVVQDLVTQRIQSYPCNAKTSQETERSSRKFLEPSERAKSH